MAVKSHIKSNLTPAQQKLVRTPEFKAWFGDWENDPENSSKVVAFDESQVAEVKMDNGEKIVQSNQFWGKSAAGVLLVCRKTKRLLLVKRSELVGEPNTWGLVAGHIEPGETPEGAVIRELIEETNYPLHKLAIKLKASEIYKKDSLTFYSYIGFVDEEFTPKLNWENTEYRWCEIGNYPEPLHYGLKKLLENIDIENETMKNGGNINSKIFAIAKQFGVKKDVVLKALKEGSKHELEHKDTIAYIANHPNLTKEEAAKLIALDHIKEHLDYYEKLVTAEKKMNTPRERAMQYLEEYRKGGNINNKCKDGCIVEGDPHSKGGVDMIIEGQRRIEVEGKEAMIPEYVIDSSKKYNFDGHSMTAAEIFNRINTEHGGNPIYGEGGYLTCKDIKFELGGDIPNLDSGQAVIKKSAVYSDKTYELNGKKMKPIEIIDVIVVDNGGNKILAEGGNVNQGCGCALKFQHGGNLVEEKDFGKKTFANYTSLFLLFQDQLDYVIPYVDGEVNNEFVIYDIKYFDKEEAKRIYDKIQKGWEFYTYKESFERPQMVEKENHDIVIKFKMKNHKLAYGGNLNQVNTIHLSSDQDIIPIIEKADKENKKIIAEVSDDQIEYYKSLGFKINETNEELRERVDRRMKSETDEIMNNPNSFFIHATSHRSYDKLKKSGIKFKEWVDLRSDHHFLEISKDDKERALAIKGVKKAGKPKSALMNTW